MTNMQAKNLREGLRLLVRRLGMLERGEAICCGVTLTQCHTIVEIAKAGNISVNELAEQLNLDKSTVSRTVDGLVNDEIILRQPDPADRRYVLLSLTPKGRRVYAGLEERSENYYTEVLASIPAEKREQVVESLGYLAEAMRGKSH